MVPSQQSTSRSAPRRARTQRHTLAHSHTVKLVRKKALSMNKRANTQTHTLKHTHTLANERANTHTLKHTYTYTHAPMLSRGVHTAPAAGAPPALPPGHQPSSTHACRAAPHSLAACALAPPPTRPSRLPLRPS